MIIKKTVYDHLNVTDDKISCFKIKLHGICNIISSILVSDSLLSGNPFKVSQEPHFDISVT